MTAVGDNRPRELHWYHAGPMLFGDLGTSRLYVLGLAFYFTRHASLFHIAFVNVLLVLVGICYLIICRKYPDGGGVYSSARGTSRALAVVGGLMLCADYTVTAALSCLDAFRYLGVGGEIMGISLELLCTLGAIAVIGAANWFGPRGMGRIALIVALVTVVLTAIIAVCALPSLHHTRIELPVRERYSIAAWGGAWVGFTEIVLALSGIEAIANMTGIMVPPVRTTSRKSILPVLAEVVVLNLILGAAMNALPDAKLIDPEGHALGTDNMMSLLASAYVGPAFSHAASFVFGALLLSAVNTAIADLMAVQYMMARDGELPSLLGRLNRHGVPHYGLLVAMLVPAALLLIFPDITELAGLYAVGVVAAITINLLTTGSTSQFELRPWERRILLGVGGVMLCILVTLLVNKPSARAFSMAVLVVGLGGDCSRLPAAPGSRPPSHTRRGFWPWRASPARWRWRRLFPPPTPSRCSRRSPRPGCWSGPANGSPSGPQHQPSTPLWRTSTETIPPSRPTFWRRPGLRASSTGSSRTPATVRLAWWWCMSGRWRSRSAERARRRISPTIRSPAPSSPRPWLPPAGSAFRCDWST